MTETWDDDPFDVEKDKQNKTVLSPWY